MPTEDIDSKARQFVERKPTEPTCKWCKHPDERIKARGLCSACYGLDLSFEKARASLRESRPEHQRILNEHRCRVLELSIENAKDEGDTRDEIRKAEATGIDVEFAFSHLSRLLVKKDLFHGHANMLDGHLAPGQKKFIYYYFNKLILEYRRQNRRQFARARHSRELIAERK